MSRVIPKPAEICRDLPKPAEICRNLSETSEIWPKFAEIGRDLLGSAGVKSGGPYLGQTDLSRYFFNSVKRFLCKFMKL